jgi:hypothetical protein
VAEVTNPTAPAGRDERSTLPRFDCSMVAVEIRLGYDVGAGEWALPRATPRSRRCLSSIFDVYAWQRRGRPMDCASSGISGRAGLEPGDAAAARGEGARLSGLVQRPEAAPRERRDPWPPIASIALRPNTEVCQYFWRKSSRILLCPAASLVISALPMKAEPFAEPNPDQDLAAASDAPGIPGIC